MFPNPGVYFNSRGSSGLLPVFFGQCFDTFQLLHPPTVFFYGMIDIASDP